MAQVDWNNVDKWTCGQHAGKQEIATDFFLLGHSWVMNGPYQQGILSRKMQGWWFVESTLPPNQATNAICLLSVPFDNDNIVLYNKS